MISVTLVDANTYEVVVGNGACRVHRVRMNGDYYRQLSGGAFTHEWVLVQAFRFLLEREPDASLPAEFDLAALAADYPGFEADIGRRLHRR
ncbi:MAG: hypothetical protein OXM56_14420 [Gammaproteobacteria bacterium]|nr:hypothetical protein [Gammaproteobacteria bacterium]